MTSSSPKILYLANPRGFCGGVDRAVALVEMALKKFGAPIFVRHEVVHNRFVVSDLRNKGAIFIEYLSEAPDGCTLVFSAHGVPLAVRNAANLRKLHILDATCPLVKKVHVEVQHLHQNGYDIVMIGHDGHPEVEGTMGQIDHGIYLVQSPSDVATLSIKNPTKLAYVTQTTLSVNETRTIIDALRARFCHIVAPKKDDICYATQNRQNAAMALAARCDVVIVVGSPNSSNSNRLCEVIQAAGTSVWMVDEADAIDPRWLTHATTIGVTAGASAPERLVQAVLSNIQSFVNVTIQELPGIEEHTVFGLPYELR